jgi:hypothetical protein
MVHADGSVVANQRAIFCRASTAKYCAGRHGGCTAGRRTYPTAPSLAVSHADSIQLDRSLRRHQDVLTTADHL